MSDATQEQLQMFETVLRWAIDAQREETIRDVKRKECDDADEKERVSSGDTERQRPEEEKGQEDGQTNRSVGKSKDWTGLVHGRGVQA